MDTASILQEDTQRGRFLTFALGGETFGLEISYVTEIVGIQSITVLPEAPNYLKGIINLRGKIIPVMDMRLKFHMEYAPYTDRTCIVVVEIQSIFIGLIVDHVSEVLSIEDSDIVAPPGYQVGVQSRYIKAIGKVGNEVKLLLDCSKLLNKDELSKIVM